MNEIIRIYMTLVAFAYLCAIFLLSAILYACIS